MAEKRYTAIFDAQDRVSDKLKKMEQATIKAKSAQESFNAGTKKARDAQERMKRSTDEAVSSIERMKRAMTSAGSGIATFGNRGMTAMKGIGSALGGIWSRLTSLPSLIMGAASAWGLFKAGELVVGGAMQKELTQLQMGALLADKNKGMDLFKLVQDKAMTSMFSEKDFSKAATTFLPITKDFGDVQKMMDINERLASSNLMEGMEGASFALREALSGDITSIAERFNISKSGLRENGFSSDGSWQQNLEAVDRTLEKMGYTAKYVDDVNNSAFAQWELFKSNTLKLFADTGEGILSKLKSPLKDLNTTLGSEKMTAFVSKMSDALAGKMESAITYVDDMNLKWDDFSRLGKAAVDIFTGVGDSFAIMMGTFDGKEGKSPREQFESFAEAMEAGARGIDEFNKSFEPFIGFLRDFSGLATKFYGKNEDGTRKKGIVEKGAQWLSGRAFSGDAWTAADGQEHGFFKQMGPLFDFFDGLKFDPNAGVSGRLRGSHMGGLSYVPSDGYPANLHKGERVLTAEQNRDYQQGANGFTIHIENMNVRNEQDIDMIGEAIARRLEVR